MRLCRPRGRRQGQGGAEQKCWSINEYDLRKRGPAQVDKRAVAQGHRSCGSINWLENPAFYLDADLGNCISREIWTSERTIISGPDAEHVPDKEAVSADDIEAFDKGTCPKEALEGNMQRTWNKTYILQSASKSAQVDTLKPVFTIIRFAFQGSVSVNFFIGRVDDSDPAIHGSRQSDRVRRYFC